jgi:hypothetical protein
MLAVQICLMDSNAHSWLTTWACIVRFCAERNPVHDVHVDDQ